MPSVLAALVRVPQKIAEESQGTKTYCAPVSTAVLTWRPLIWAKPMSVYWISSGAQYPPTKERHRMITSYRVFGCRGGGLRTESPSSLEWQTEWG